MSSELVREALRAAIRHDGDVLLVTTGDQTGIFPDRKPKTKTAIKACLKDVKPLLEVKREQPGKGKIPNQYVSVTDHGIIFLVQATPLAELPKLIEESVPSLKSRVLRRAMRSIARRKAEEDNPRLVRALVQTCFGEAQSLFDSFAEERERLLEEEKALAMSSRDFINSLLGKFDRAVKKVTGEMQKITEECVGLVKPAQRPEPESPDRPAIPSLTPVPSSDIEFDFQRSVGKELVLAWRDADTAEARESLERVMMNVGIEAVGNPGDRVVYDGLVHRAEAPVKAGESVEVTRPGWQLVNARGNFLISPAIVRAVRHERSQAESSKVGGNDGDGSQH